MQAGEFGLRKVESILLFLVDGGSKLHRLQGPSQVVDLDPADVTEPVKEKGSQEEQFPQVISARTCWCVSSVSVAVP